jgi:hypothetical protein
MSTAVEKSWSPFSVNEWYRLSELAEKYEPKMRLAFLRATQTRRQFKPDEIRGTLTSIVAETCDTTADVYGLVFNPDSRIYGKLIDDLVDTFVSTFESRKAAEAVRRILPPGLPFDARRRRTDTFGLDERSAIMIEQMYQAGNSVRVIEQARATAFHNRGNMIAVTETNRAVNRATLCLWLDNYPGEIEKARRPRPKVVYIGTSRRRVMAAPHKTWMTRRDTKVCNYCDPLEGVTARIDAEFVTKYGIFETPPIHPRCRCFMLFG